MKELELQTGSLKDIVKILHEAGYTEVTERRIKQYVKDEYIRPRRLNPKNPKSKYRYTNEDLQYFQILFSFMMVYPLIEEAGPLVNVLRANFVYLTMLADDEFIAKLKSAEIDFDQEPWQTFFDAYCEVYGEEIRYEPNQVWEKIQAAFHRITQAQIILATVIQDIAKLSGIANQSDRVELVHKFEETIAKKSKPQRPLSRGSIY
ncbi:MAG: hypothetical protein QME64_12780 [bacterium]|nr:hypothetical protein [bacterium]